MIELVKLELKDGDSIPIAMRHDIRMDTFDEPRSCWHPTSLEFYLEDNPSGHLTLKLPGFRPRTLKLQDGRGQADGVSVSKRGEIYTATTQEGRIFLFTGSTLMGFMDRTGCFWPVTVKGGLITAILRSTDFKAIIQATYDDTGHLIGLESGGERLKLSWTGWRLDRISKQMVNQVELKYSSNLLASIHRQSDSVENISWQRNSFYDPFRTPYLKPVSLSSFGARRFKVTLSDVGVKIISTDAATVFETIYNPVTGRFARAKIAPHQVR